MSIMRASRKKIEEWDTEALGLSEGEVGSAGSAVEILEVRAPKMERKRVIIEAETPEEAAERLVEKLMEEGVLR